MARVLCKTLERAFLISRKKGRPSCLFCKKLGNCTGEPGNDCPFQPNKWWPEKRKPRQKILNFMRLK